MTESISNVLFNCCTWVVIFYMLYFICFVKVIITHLSQIILLAIYTHVLIWYINTLCHFSFFIYQTCISYGQSDHACDYMNHARSRHLFRICRTLVYKRCAFEGGKDEARRSFSPPVFNSKHVLYCRSVSSFLPYFTHILFKLSKSPQTANCGNFVPFSVPEG